VNSIYFFHGTRGNTETVSQNKTIQEKQPQNTKYKILQDLNKWWDCEKMDFISVSLSAAHELRP
jgi:hypothetical protein